MIDGDQNIVAEASAPLDVSRPSAGWSEQNPHDWIAAAEAVLDRLATSEDLGQVVGIGLSGQMHGATLLDASHNVLRPCILWNDTRSHEEAAKLDADPVWRRTTGNIVFPGFTAPKLVWIKRFEPEIFSRISKVLLPKDFLRFWLTGEFVTDMSDASGTSWLEIARRNWSDDLLACTDLGRAHMPRLVEGLEVSGELRSSVAGRWGFRQRVSIAGGGGDNAASAMAAGVTREGQALVSLGTSGVLFAANDSYRPDPESAVHTFCHAIPDTWHQMGVVLSATDSLNWFARLIGEDAVTLTSDLGALRPPGRTTFLPYLGGERTPLNDPTVRGAFLGLEHATDRVAATRAVLEGVSFAIRDCRDSLAATGTTIDSLQALGGGSRSDYWLQVVATALNISIDRPSAADLGGAFGAARLAMMAVIAGGASLASVPRIDRSIDPDSSLIPEFDEGFDRYKAAQLAVRSGWDETRQFTVLPRQ